MAAGVVAALVGGVASIAAAVGASGRDASAAASGAQTPTDGRSVPDGPPRASTIPAPAQSSGPRPPDSGGSAEGAVAGDPCGLPAVQQALEAGDDAVVIAAAGGAEAFRAAVAAGAAPCVDLSDPARTWVVVNKQRPLDPIDFAPGQTSWAEGVRRTGTEQMRTDVAAALAGLAAAARDEGAGEIGVNSAFRSYGYQVENHDRFVRDLGREGAELTSSRPGHSEHQTGLAVDIVACDPSCGGIRAFGGTAQARWVADNAWRHGFVVRYDDGQTGETGYEWEPWHLRYIGRELAAAYAEGGYRTLERFFGLPAAPDYPG